MTTGPAWNLSNPLKPVADFDRHATRDIPFEWTLWLADQGTAYASHVIVADLPLACVDSEEAGGVITARVRVVDQAAAVTGRSYPVRCHIVAADGQEDDTTLWLRIVDR